MRAPSQRLALGALFAVLAIGLGAIAAAAARAGRWVIGAPAAALALWMGSLALRVLQRR